MIPPDIEEGIWNVSLFGVKDGSKRNTTIPATLKLVKSGYNPQGQPPIQPPEDLYAKLIKQIDEANKIAQSVRDDADAGKFDGKDGKSAYELAVENGFVGKEQEWLESLRYDHSEEFTKLAEQVKQDSVSTSNSAQAASRSATNAASSEANAKRSENASKQSEVNAKQSETNAEKSVEATKLSEANAKVSEMEAKKSEESAKQSADYAAQSVDSIVDKLAIKSESKEETHLIQDSVDYAFDEFFMYGKSTQSGTPSPEMPVEIVSAGQSGQIKTDVLGGNLLDLSQGKSGTREGVTYTKNPDWSYRRTGTATGANGNVWFLGGYSVDPNLQEKVLFKQGTYTVKDCKLFSDEEGLRNTFTIDSDFKVTGVRNPNQVVGQTYNDVLYPMLNVGSSALPFESYKQPQTIILTTPNGLSGIPVSGDDYTYIDSTGQKWIADTIEYRKDGKCVRVQRIGKETIVGGFNIVQTPNVPGRYYTIKNILKNTYKDGGLKSMCNIATWRAWSNEAGDVKTNNWFALNGRNMYFTPKGNVADWNAEKVNNLLNGIPSGVTVLGQLANYIETPLTPEEIAAFKALHTNKPTTTIINNADITTKVKYITDTKKYIDSKFVALAKQLIKS